MTDFIATATPSISRRLPRRQFGFFAFMGLRKQRQDLSRLSAEQLADIGVTVQQAEQEAARPIWDIPQHWKG